LELDANTQVFLYLGVHGMEASTKETRIVRPADTQICGNTIDLGPLLGVDEAALASQDNLSGPVLELYVRSLGPGPIPSGYDVHFNGVPVSGGSIPGGEPEAELLLPIEASLVQSSGNEIWLSNDDPGADPIVVEAYFSTGEIALHAREDLGPIDGRRPGD
jgi:hypothetical protein